MENPFKGPFPSDEFGGYGSDNVARLLFERPGSDWYAVCGCLPEWRDVCAVPRTVSATRDGVSYWRNASDDERQSHCDACRACWVWWRRYSENPRWTPARLKGGAA